MSTHEAIASSEGAGDVPMPLIDIRELSIYFRTRNRSFCALNRVSLCVSKGEAVGLVGESGSGKSITWLAALSLLGSRVHVSGQVLLDGQPILGLGDAALSKIRGRRVAMIFQDASSALNPVRRIGSQLIEGLRLHWGMDDRSAMAEGKRLLDHVQMPNAAQRLHEYPHQLSGGMNQRVMIAIALAGRPDLLIADEPTTALDTTVQAQILGLLDELRRDTGMALVLISHDFGVVAEICDRVVVMYSGRLMEAAPNPDIFVATAHPYTLGLLSAVPDPVHPMRPTEPIPGSVPEPWNIPPGCVFEPRCKFAIPACRERVPALSPVARHAATHYSACIRADEIDSMAGATTGRCFV